MKKIYLIIGHRGTGKSTWAKEAHLYFKSLKKPSQVIDVDEEIIKTTNESIENLFLKGEDYFRSIEREVALDCFKKADSFSGVSLISIGAGFSGDTPSHFHTIFLKRWSDSSGRIFLNRPRILPHLEAHEESLMLYKKREPIYQKMKDETLMRPEYYSSFQEWDSIFLNDVLPFKNGVLTLNSQTAPKNLKKREIFLKKRIQWGVKYFELRDDQVDESFLSDTLRMIPSSKILFSFRKKSNPLFLKYVETQNSYFVDLPFEGLKEGWQFIKNIKPTIVSLHNRDKNQSLEKQLDEFSKIKAPHLKLAPSIYNFKELMICHHWSYENQQRSFHPRSKTGRWKWYRLLFNPYQEISFFKEEDSTVKDQPFLAESILYKRGAGAKGFACVLGDPIELSMTPFEHRSFFENDQMPVVSICMKEDECNEDNLKLLNRIGLKFAAVTTPLKKKASALSSHNLPIKSINTLLIQNHKIYGYNTDIQGAESLKNHIESDSIVVWGGGGVNATLKYVFKNAYFFSARTGELKESHSQPLNINPEILIWAVGRSRMSDCQYPPSDWDPKIVYDLNYTEDSPAKEYALKVQAKYISGIGWFKAQAQQQRDLFEQTFLK